MRSAAFLAAAAAAYLASCAATHEACAEIDVGFRWDPGDASTGEECTLSLVNARLPAVAQLPADGIDKLKQKAISKCLESQVHDAWLTSKEVSEQAAVLSETLAGASGFLKALPSKPLGLAWVPEESMGELQAWLLMPF